MGGSNRSSRIPAVTLLLVEAVKEDDMDKDARDAIWKRVNELRADPEFQKAVAEEIEISRKLLDLLAKT